VSEVRIAVEGETILGKMFRPGGDAPGPAVLFVHGWGASQRHDVGKAKRLARLGFTGLTFNLRGHARTRRQVETVSRAHNFADLLAAYDLLAADPAVDPRRVALVGASYGGYLATLLTERRAVRWLALQAPAIYQDGDFDRPKRELNLDGELPGYRQRRLAPEDNRVLAAAARFTGDALVIESGRDAVIPGPVVENYVDAFRRSPGSISHYVLDEADHALSEDRWRRRYGELVTRWLGERAEIGGRVALGAPA
jgi:uncharacterized protein